MLVVSDTSPLTNLYQVDQLDLLPKLFGDIIIPETVFKELLAIPEQAELFVSLPWIRVVSVNQPYAVEKLLEELHQGEAEARKQICC